jgi:hypothetical protein
LGGFGFGPMGCGALAPPPGPPPPPPPPHRHTHTHPPTHTLSHTQLQAGTGVCCAARDGSRVPRCIWLCYGCACSYDARYATRHIASGEGTPPNIGSMMSWCEPRCKLRHQGCPAVPCLCKVVLHAEFVDEAFPDRPQCVDRKDLSRSHAVYTLSHQRTHCTHPEENRPAARTHCPRARTLAHLATHTRVCARRQGSMRDRPSRRLPRTAQA